MLVASVDLASSYLSKGGTFGGPDDDHYFVDLLHPGMQVHSERPEPSGRVRPPLDVQLLGDPQVRLQLDRLCASKRSSDHDDDHDSMKQEGGVAKLSINFLIFPLFIVETGDKDKDYSMSLIFIMIRCEQMCCDFFVVNRLETRQRRGGGTSPQGVHLSDDREWIKIMVKY